MGSISSTLKEELSVRRLSQLESIDLKARTSASEAAGGGALAYEELNCKGCTWWVC